MVALKIRLLSMHPATVIGHQIDDNCLSSGLQEMMKSQYCGINIREMMQYHGGVDIVKRCLGRRRGQQRLYKKNAFGREIPLKLFCSDGPHALRIINQSDTLNLIDELAAD